MFEHVKYVAKWRGCISSEWGVLALYKGVCVCKFRGYTQTQILLVVVEL